MTFEELLLVFAKNPAKTAKSFIESFMFGNTWQIPEFQRIKLNHSQFETAQYTIVSSMKRRCAANTIWDFPTFYFLIYVVPNSVLVQL